MRQQVLGFFTYSPDPSKRTTALNEHIMREADHQSPVYINVERFDAGTVFVPGQLDARFDNMWLNDVADMTSNSWAGNITLNIAWSQFDHDSMDCTLAGCVISFHHKITPSIFTWQTKNVMNTLTFLRYIFITLSSRYSCN
jgi:hypothetical protein